MVVYTGMTCKMMMHSNYKKKKSNYLQSISTKITFYTMLLVIFLAGISLIVLFSRVDEHRFMEPYDEYISNGMKIFNLLILYSQLIPISLYLVQDLVHLVMKFKIEREIINSF